MPIGPVKLASTARQVSTSIASGPSTASRICDESIDAASMLAWKTAHVASLMVRHVLQRELEARDFAHLAAEAHQFLGHFVRQRDPLADGECFAGEEIGERVRPAERVHVERDDFVFVERRDGTLFVGDEERFAVAADAVDLAFDRLRRELRFAELAFGGAGRDFLAGFGVAD